MFTSTALRLLIATVVLALTSACAPLPAVAERDVPETVAEPQPALSACGTVTLDPSPTPDAHLNAILGTLAQRSEDVKPVRDMPRALIEGTLDAHLNAVLGTLAQRSEDVKPVRDTPRALVEGTLDAHLNAIFGMLAAWSEDVTPVCEMHRVIIEGTPTSMSER